MTGFPTGVEHSKADVNKDYHASSKPCERKIMHVIVKYYLSLSTIDRGWDRCR